MIQENALNLHGYATLILCDSHGEYPIPRPEHNLSHYRVEVIYSSFEVDQLREHIGLSYPPHASFAAFPGLGAKYNGYYEPGMDIWLVRGSVDYLMDVYHAYAKIVVGVA